MIEVKYAFTGGELDQRLWGRSDLERYALSAARLENFVVTYSGSAETRRPLRFAEFTSDADAPIRFFAFEFSNDVDNTYLVIFGAGWIRFVQDGAYVLETSKTVTGVADGAVASTAHGYADGDLVYLDNFPQIFVVNSATTNAFDLLDIDGNAAILTAGATNARRVFTLTHAYSGADLATVKANQVFDVIKFTHPSYPPKLLTRVASAWTFTDETRLGGLPLSGSATAVSSGKYIRSVRVTASGSGYTNASTLTVADSTGSGAVLVPTVEAGVIVAVTIIEQGKNYSAPTVTATLGAGATFEITLSKTEAELVFTGSAVVEGKETGIFRPVVLQNIPDITQAQGTYTFAVPAVSGAESYNYYRSIVYPFEDQANIGVELGWIGSSRAPKFTDNNIQPDFTRTPRLFFDPFVSGQILSARATAVGANYTPASTITVNDPTGTGAILYPIVENGALIGVYIANGGANYTNPAFTISGGTGATIAATLSETTGNNPAVSFIFQQRAGYAGTTNQPMTLWASRLEEFENFAASDILDASDPYSYTLDSTRVSPIRHALSAQRGLLLFTRDEVSLLRAEDGVAVTALNGVLDLQTYVGATEVPPVFANEDVIYVQEKSRGLRLLAFNGNSRRFEGTEISLFSRHLFEQSVVCAFVSTIDTQNQIYGVFENGTGFAGTILRDQQVFGFTPIKTFGRLEDVARLNVGTEEHVYFAVTRNGRRSIEYMRPYETNTTEDLCCFDGRISTPKIFPAANIEVSLTNTIASITASAGVFTSGDVGKLIFIGHGRGIVASYVSATEITATMTREIQADLFLNSVEAEAGAGQWWLNPLVSSISGIPYEGQTVAVMVDGKRQADKVVVDGEITLDNPGAIVHVGFPFRATLKTLPPLDTETMLVNILSATVYYKRAGAISLGVGSEASIQQTRTPAPFWFEPTVAQPSEPVEKETYLNGGWNTQGSVTIELSDGIAAEILRVAIKYDTGGETRDPPNRRR